MPLATSCVRYVALVAFLALELKLRKNLALLALRFVHKGWKPRSRAHDLNFPSQKLCLAHENVSSTHEITYTCFAPFPSYRAIAVSSVRDGNFLSNALLMCGTLFLTVL